MNKTMEVTTGSTSRKRVLALGLLLCNVLCAGLCEAAESPDRSLLEDTKLYVTAPLRWETREWMQFAGTIFAIGVAHEFDVSVRHAFEPTGGQPLDGQDPH